MANAALELAVALASTLASIILLPVMLFGGLLLMGHGLNIHSDLVAGAGFIGQIAMWLGGLWYLTR